MTANRISSDSDINLGGMESVTPLNRYGPTMLLLRYSDRKESLRSDDLTLLQVRHLDSKDLCDVRVHLSQQRTISSYFPLVASINLEGVPVRLLALAMAAVCASRAVVKSAVSCRMASKVMAGVSDVDVLLGGILLTVHR
ncbi:hypothetical protein Tco_0522384 [Tanacetum coccineum]